MLEEGKEYRLVVQTSKLGRCIIGIIVGIILLASAGTTLYILSLVIPWVVNLTRENFAAIAFLGIIWGLCELFHRYVHRTL